MALASWQVQMFHMAYWIPQGTTARYSLQLTDEAGAALTLTQVTTVTLTIFDLGVKPPVVIAGTWPRDVKNVAPGGVVSSSGLLTLTLSPTDNALIDETHAYELRRWRVHWTHATGAKAQTFEVDRVLVNTLEGV
jgi:hypothetical protein